MQARRSWEAGEGVASSDDDSLCHQYAQRWRRATEPAYRPPGTHRVHPCARGFQGYDLQDGC